MIFTETKLAGAFIIDVNRLGDSRGFFARSFCQNEFKKHGLKPTIAQGNIAYNKKKGTLRGMHFQFPPKAESKLVRCTRGAIIDIIVDLRPESPTFLQHIAVELTADNYRALYVPRDLGMDTRCSRAARKRVTSSVNSTLHRTRAGSCMMTRN